MPPTQNHGTTELRVMWHDYACKGGGEWADIDFFGKKIGGVPEVMVDAYAALEQALTATGYHPPEKCQSLWSYVCRNIASSGRPSLHSYGIAIDIDPYHNPQAHVPPYSGWFSEAQVTAVMAILNPQGGRVWWWGGYWSGFTTPDLMHFQADQPLDGVQVDWSTVAGSSEPEPIIPDEGDEMTLTEGSKGNAVRSAQKSLNNWSAANKKGWSVAVDGTWEKGSKMTDRVKEFQKALNLEETGTIDGLTAAYLVGRYDPPDLS